MAYAMTKQGSLDNCVTYEFICDAVEDMNAIEDRYRTIGTVAIVLSGASGLEVYIAGSDKQWNSLSSIGGSAASDTAGLSIYICGQDEVSEGVPDVELPDEQTLYLVPAADPDSGNLYDEYIYVEGEWEKFGSGGSAIDLSGYYQKPATGIPASDLASGVIPDISALAPKASPVFTGSISLGRASEGTIGPGSVAEGYNVIAAGNDSHAEGASTKALAAGSHAEGSGTTASGGQSHAEGGGTTASGGLSHAEGGGTQATGQQSHAEGGGTKASGSLSHAEGGATIASGDNSHAEGGTTTASGNYSHAEGGGARASGDNSHAEGFNTIASGMHSHVSGSCNIADSYDNWPEWTANTSYNVGDKVKRTTGSGVDQTVGGYICKTPNSDSAFTGSKWNYQSGKMNYAEIIGNGLSTSSRSNARALDWDGNEYLNGDLYVGCNTDSTGGTKLPRIPEAPSTDGTYILQATVTNGTPTYSWVSLSSLSGVTF